MIWSSPYFIFGTVIAYLAVTIWVVYRWGASKATEEDYYVAGRTIGPFANTMTIVATIMSGGIYLGTVGFFYLYGVGFVGYGFAYALMVFPLWYLGKRLWPVAKAFNYSTPQDFYGDFYQSEFLRLLGAVGGIIFLIPYFASNAVAMGFVLERFAGVPYNYGVLLLLVVGVAYTAYGGMRAVIYTDVFQGVLSIAFGVVAVPVLLYLAGGFTKVMDTLPPKVTTFTPDAASLGLFIGWVVFMLSHPLTMGDRMTRMYTIRNLDDYKKNVVLTAIVLLIMCTIFLFLGLLSRVFAGAPVPGRVLDEYILITIQQQAPWLMAWLVVVVWACGMSTLDSGLIGANAMLSKDIIRRYIKRDIPEERLILAGRWAMLVFGLLAVWIAIQRPPGIWALVRLVVMYYMQFLPLLVGALYWKRASKLGAEVGWVVGVALGTYYSFSATRPLIDVGGAPAAGFFGLLVNTILFVGISLAVSPVPAAHRAKFERAWGGGRP